MTTLQKLEEAAKAATPGPWKKKTRHCEAVIYTDKEGFLFPQLGNSEQAHDDAVYIALANPATILALCERERQRDSLVEELVSALGDVCSLIESGDLVRNIEQDDDTLAFVKQSLKITSAIAAAGNATSKAASFITKDARL